jgi:ribonuclease-3
MTHASAIQGGGDPSYERLEFLGDRVLGLVVADMLLAQFPGEPEGPLAQRLADLVRRETLSAVALELDLGTYLRIAKTSQDESERQNPAILADVCEAVIGALYLDGDLPAARRFIEPIWRPLLIEARKPPQDAKTALQEWAQGRGLPLPEYRETARSGPDHEPVFTIEVAVAGHGAESADGRSKRQAEQAAAARLLARLLA